MCTIYYRAGMPCYTYYNSPIGQLLLECNNAALTGLWIEGQKHYAAGSDIKIFNNNNHPIFDVTRDWLDAYFAGRNPKTINIPLKPRGTDFQKCIWDVLCTIPYGSTTTYSNIARKLNTSPRAAGGAVGRNPISIIIPCHRVVGTNNKLTGYAGGLDIKAKLLELEDIIPQ